MQDDTRDIALTAVTQIRSHIDACERRYQEGNLRLEKLFEFIKDAHSENRKDIGEIKGVLAEQRGAGKTMKAIVAAGAAVLGLIGGIVGSFLHK